jgi:hypothetical protein
VLANLEQAQVEAISFGVAGLIEPALQPPHLGPLPAAAPPVPRPSHMLLKALARGVSVSGVTPELHAFLSPKARAALRPLTRPEILWTFAGCDAVASQRIERLGASVDHLCYARGHANDADHLLEVVYTADRRVAVIDW